jgi:oligopeptide transport system substrate-binding protein
MVVSGAYLPVAQTETSVHLEANPRYWAGEPPLAAIELLTDLEGESPVALFEEGRVDHTDISAFDATWIRYDPDLGPQLRHADAFSVDYYGFDTTEAPFDDARVRRAFAQAVDWDRIARLADAEGEPATSLVAAGIPGRGEADRSPVHDPDAARVLLEEAGFPDGDGFPEVRITGNGLPYDQAVAHELSRELSVTVRVEVRPFDEYAALLDADPPQMWSLSWIADYPHPHAFLGLLLETGSSSNEGRWSDPAFDAALDRAALEVDPAGQAAAYDAAEAIVQRSAPLIPVAYGETWSLSRSGLLGATESGVGFKRFASLRWADGP